MSRRHLWPSSFASGTKYQYCGGIRKACCCYWPVCSLRPVPNAAGEWSPAKSQQFQLQGTWKAVFHWMLAVGANLSTCKDLQQSCNHMQVDSDVEDLRWLESSGLVKVSFTQRLSRICSDPRLRVYNFSASHCWSWGFPPIYRMETGTWKTGQQMQQMKQMPKSFLSIS